MGLELTVLIYSDRKLKMGYLDRCLGSIVDQEDDRFKAAVVNSPNKFIDRGVAAYYREKYQGRFSIWNNKDLEHAIKNVETPYVLFLPAYAYLYKSDTISNLIALLGRNKVIQAGLTYIESYAPSRKNGAEALLNIENKELITSSGSISCKIFDASIYTDSRLYQEDLLPDLNRQKLIYSHHARDIIISEVAK